MFLIIQLQVVLYKPTLFYKTINGAWRSCNDNLLKNANNQWNWAIMNNSTGCASYTNGNGNGFILHGNTSSPDEATLLYGLNQYSASSSWNKVEIFFREKQNNNYPKSCLDLYSQGERASGTYTIDPDGEGKGKGLF